MSPLLCPSVPEGFSRRRYRSQPRGVPWLLRGPSDRRSRACQPTTIVAVRRRHAAAESSNTASRRRRINGTARLAVVAFLALIVGHAPAADLPGAKDHPAVKRFAGSEIVGYGTKRFDEYALQTSTFVKYNLRTLQREFASQPLALEGAITRLWYECAGETSSTELLRNYQTELRSAGFAVLYDSTKDPKATYWDNYFAPYAQKMVIPNSRTVYVFASAPTDNAKVSTFKRTNVDGGATYIALEVLEWPGNSTTFRAARGAYASVTVVDVSVMKQNMVTISASDISQTLRANGHVGIYGIYFDTNKALLKPESGPALQEIAKLLQAEQDLRLHVVGHTDNQGGLDQNLTLSKQRADAVTAALRDDHGINAARLQANGVAYLAPVASNASEEGRAKNRRVELVPQ